MRDPDDTYQNQLVPMVVEETNRGERAYDIYSQALLALSYVWHVKNSGPPLWRMATPASRPLCTSGIGLTRRLQRCSRCNRVGRWP
jgi:hypothetical protein